MKNIFNWLKVNFSTKVLIIMFGFVGILSVISLFSSKLNKDFRTYQEFMADFNTENINEITYSGASEKMTITLKDGSSYETFNPGYEDFRKDMLEAGITLSFSKNTNWVDYAGSVLSIAIMIPFAVYFVKLIKEQMDTEFDEKHLLQTSDVKFADVIGQNEIRNDIMFYADLLKNPEKGIELGAIAPKGILFEGGPGCGKTMIAKAVAGEAGVPFISVSGASFIEKYVGVGAQRVRKVFEVARENAPCVVFIDEIDAVGMQRNGNSCSEYSQTVNALLTEMDGFSSESGILVIAATNRADMLDEALVRAGRFDRTITIAKPKDYKVRKKLLEHYLADKKLAEDVDLECLAKQIAGYTGADIKAVCNEASTIALQKKLHCINMECLEEAVDKKVFGGNRVKNSKERNKDKKIVAYHEAGHAVITWLCKEPIARASIIGTTSGVGGAVFREDKESQFMTRNDVENFVKICYGGRASEAIKFGKENITTGAASDIQQATKMLTNAVSRYGLYSDEYGMLDVATLKELGLASGEKDALQVLKETSDRLYKETFTMLSEHYELVTVLAEKLLEVGTMSGDDVEALLQFNDYMSDWKPK